MSARTALAGFMRGYAWPCLAAAGAVLLIQGAVALYLEPLAGKEADAVAYMKAEVAKVDRDIAEIRQVREVTASALACRQVSSALNDERNRATRILDEIARVRADAMRFTVVEQYGGTVDLRGEARSYLAISELIERVDGSPVLERASLRSVSPQPGVAQAAYPLAFEVRVRVRGSNEGTRPSLFSDTGDPR